MVRCAIWRRNVSLLGRRFLRLCDPAGGIDSPAVLDALSFRMLLAALVGWLDQRQQDAVAYLIEENRILRTTCTVGSV